MRHVHHQSYPQWYQSSRLSCASNRVYPSERLKVVPNITQLILNPCAISGKKLIRDLLLLTEILQLTVYAVNLVIYNIKILVVSACYLIFTRII